MLFDLNKHGQSGVDFRFELIKSKSQCIALITIDILVVVLEHVIAACPPRIVSRHGSHHAYPVHIQNNHRAERHSCNKKTWYRHRRFASFDTGWFPCSQRCSPRSHALANCHSKGLQYSHRRTSSHLRAPSLPVHRSPLMRCTQRTLTRTPWRIGQWAYSAIGRTCIHIRINSIVIVPKQHRSRGS